MYRAAAGQRILARIGAGALYKPRLKDGFAVANGRAQGMRIDLDELGAGAVSAPAFEGVGFHADMCGGFGSRKQLGCCGHFGKAPELTRLVPAKEDAYGVPVLPGQGALRPLGFSVQCRNL